MSHTFSGLTPQQYISLSLRGVHYRIIETEKGNMLEILYGAKKPGRNSGYKYLRCARAIYLGLQGNCAQLRITGPFHMDCTNEKENVLSIELQYITHCQPA